MLQHSTTWTTMLGFMWLLLLLCCCRCCSIQPADGLLRTHHSRVAFVLPSIPYRTAVPSSIIAQQLAARGGASVSLNNEDESDEEEEEEEEEQEELDAALAASAVKSASKQKSKLASAKKSAVKKAVNAKLAPAKKKKSSGGLLKMLHVPYIIRACMNPFTCIAMIKAYWMSLFNLDYLKPDASQELRSALEQKAKKSGGSGSGGGRGKRKMKRGQAKTLSDLPALNT